MSSRKENIGREQKRELRLLKRKAAKLQEKLNQQRFEQWEKRNIRNLRIFKSTCKFLVPLTLVTCVTVYGGKAAFDKLPLQIDEVKGYKTYSLEYQTNGVTRLEENYQRPQGTNSDTSNSIVAYTPWELVDGMYKRVKREYTIGTIKSFDLMDAVLNEDYDCLSECLSEYREETQITNHINPYVENGYFLEAKLHMQDQEDILLCPETPISDFMTLFIEVVTIVGICSFLKGISGYKYINEVKRILREYQANRLPLEETRRELREVNQKVLSLSAKLGGRI